MSTGGKSKTHNRLWIARRRKGLAQKQVAVLLNHHTVDQVSRYEKGLRTPTLETALKLEIIYGTPLRDLFKDHYDQLRAQLEQKIHADPTLRRIFEQGELNGEGEHCAYVELLRNASPSDADRDRVRRHVTRLARKLAYL